MNLLLINDIVMETDTMAAQIPWADYGVTQVLTAYSAADARQLIRNTPIDILLCDIEMPGEDGLSLIRWINEAHYDIDCILLTCHADFSYAKEGISLGCRDYLLLPATYKDIGQSVLKVCLRRQQRQKEARLQSYGKTWLESHAGSAPEEGASVSAKGTDIVEKCIQYILNHIADEDLSVTKIAASVYLNPVHLNRIFRKEKGTNLSQWITRERMELAGELLRTENFTANEVASRVGYGNYPYFSTVFKSYFGCAPSQYTKAQTSKMP